MDEYGEEIVDFHHEAQVLAVRQHEYYSAFVGAGFSDAQAFELTRQTYISLLNQLTLDD